MFLIKNIMMNIVFGNSFSHTEKKLLEPKQALLGARKLHLGCGPHVKQGWHNIDGIVAPGIVSWDLSSGLSCVDSDTIDLMFTEHFIEHIKRDEAVRLLADCYRALRKGGVIRVSTPCLGVMVKDYARGHLVSMPQYGWTPATLCQAFNEGMRSWGHQFVYDAPELELVFKEAGFVHVQRVPHGESAIPDLCGIETRPKQDDLIYEATK